MLKQKIYLVLGIGTDVGKTFLVENLCRILPNVMAIKPIVSGSCDDDKNSDPAKILTALGQKISQKNLDLISPWRFEKAISPHLAGKINFSAVRKFCLTKIFEAKSRDQFLFIEAAGGVMTPITAKKTFLDLAVELQVPILLVSANYLGSISHTLCAIEALRNRKISVEKIIINEDLPLLKKPSQTISSIVQNFTKIETISLQKFLNQLT
jgi:dethiobiotin synthetase